MGAGVDRREFFKVASAGLAAAALPPNERQRVSHASGAGPGAPASERVGEFEGRSPSIENAQSLAEKNKFDRIASCSYPIRYIFKSRPRPAGAPPGGGGSQLSEELKKKYGEITMLDFPQFTKDTFPGVTHMDLFSGLFGDVTDDSMFAGRQFDPSSPSGRKWLDALVAKMAATGTKLQHISNNAPTNLAESDTALRKAGVEIGKRWLDAAVILGAKSVRMNSPQALGPSIRPNAIIDPETRYPKNNEIPPLLNNAIESYKEMADYGGDRGVKVTIENHWGLAADPINIRIILEDVNHPYCEASPDFCNWEHEHMLFSGLKALAPYAHTNVHAKYWDRWGEKNDVQRATRIMLAGGFKGTFALEYEAGPLNGIEGAKYLYKEVLAALSSPTPVV
ncbi:MAG: xylose isomerase [Acidobacteria bacterium]|nr:MAG: xylose isomerase [Acidobacteriota bacterium]